MSNLKEILTLISEPALPDNWCLLEIHLHDGGMDVRFYRPFSTDDVIITAKTLIEAVTKFHDWMKETDIQLASIGA